MCSSDLEIDLYYKEREWRLVPSTLNLRSGIIRKESESERYLYSFKRSDVNVIVVPNDELRGEVLKYLQSFQTSSDERLKEFANAPPPIINYDDLHQW